MRLSGLACFALTLSLLAGGCEKRRLEDSGERLYRAAEMGNFELVRKLLSGGVNVDSRARDGRTALHKAAAGGHSAVAQLLIARGADVNALDKEGWSPVVLGMLNGHREIVELLVAEGAPVTLHVAACLGDREKAKDLIAGGVDVNRKEGGQTPLGYAASYNQYAIAELLIAAGADVNAKNGWGSTPLHRAVSQNHREMAQLLVTKGADVNVKDGSGSTPLHTAVRETYTQMAQLLITKGADVNARKHENGETPLYVAAEEGRVDMVKLLLAAGANGNTEIEDRYDDRTALQTAIGHGWADVVEMLVSAGANVNAKDTSGRTPLFEAITNYIPHSPVIDAIIQKEHPDADRTDPHRDMALRREIEERLATRIVNCLLAHGADASVKTDGGRTLLHEAACGGYAAIAELLIAHGADVNAVTSRGSGEYYWGFVTLPAGTTPLHCAAGYGDEDVVQLLLAHGARVNSRDNQGGTPLLRALEGGHTAAAKALIAAGAEQVVVRKRLGTTTLHDAFRENDRGLIVLLLTNSADVDQKDEAGNTLLHSVARAGDKAFVQLCLTHGADVNAKNASGITPLSYAASEGYTDIVALLLANGANVNACENDGDTPLHVAAFHGRRGVVELLVSQGADLHARNSRGRTPLDEAARRGHKEIVESLKSMPAAMRTPVQGRQLSRAEVNATGPAEKAEASNNVNLDNLRVHVPDDVRVRRNVKTLARENSAFAVDLYRQLRLEKGNVFFSPYSISAALAMTYAGAREKTEKEMAETLHFSLSQADLHPAFGELRAVLSRIQQAGNCKLHTANSLWPQQGQRLLNEYLSLAERYYGVSITPVDYTTEDAREAARRTINKWVEERTQGIIKDLLQPQHLNEFTRLVLSNAIYFKGLWERQFDPDDTKEAVFHLTQKKSIDVPMMNQEAEFGHTESRGLQILELPYRGNELSMLVLLPNEIHGLSQLEGSLSVESIERWRSSLERKKVMVFLPKFKMTLAIELKPVLQAMGMIDAFQFPQANFAGFDGNPQWFFIGQVVHKAYVDVNEEGTEAAAATAVVMGMGGMGVRPPVFRVDHPFLFLIQENRTGSILFMGRVTDPTQTGGGQ